MRKYHLLFCLLLSASTVWAQTQFIGKASRYSLGLYEEFTLSYTINEQGRNFVEPPELRRFFNVISGPSTSMQSYMDNTGVRTSFTISFVVQARQQGKFTLGEASIEAGGNKYKAKPITIEVTERKQAPADPNDPMAIAAKLAYARALISKREVYVGEPLSLQYKLYFKTDIRQWELLNQPDFTNFYKQQIDEDQRKTNIQQEQVNGEEVNTAVIYKALLMPQKAGTYKPGNLDIKLPTGIPTNRVDFWTNRPVMNFVNQVSSHNVGTITVKALPEAGKPDDFTGGVGSFKLEAIVSRKELNANESLTIKYRLSGSGNLKFIEIPELSLPPTLETFEPKSNDKISINEKGMGGSKSVEYLIIPRYAGVYKIPAMSLSYFDLQTKKYKTLKTEEIEIKVLGGPKYTGNAHTPSGSGLSPTEKENVDFIAKDIRFIKTTHDKLRPKSDNFFGSKSFYTLWLSLFMAFPLVGFIFYLIGRGKQSAFAKSRGLSKQLNHHLKAARKHSKQVDKAAQELDKALALLWTEALSLAPAEQNTDNILQAIEEKNITDLTTEEVRSLLDTLSMARFGLLRNTQADELIAQTEALIKKIAL